MNRQTLARTATLIGYFGLLILVIVWSINPTQLDRSSTVIALVFGGIPLLIGMFGILRRNAYTHAWISMITLGYFIHGVTELWSQPDNRIYASLEVSLSILLYLGASFFARFRAQELKGKR